MGGHRFRFGEAALAGIQSGIRRDRAEQSEKLEEAKNRVRLDRELFLRTGVGLDRFEEGRGLFEALPETQQGGLMFPTTEAGTQLSGRLSRGTENLPLPVREFLGARDVLQRRGSGGDRFLFDPDTRELIRTPGATKIIPKRRGVGDVTLSTLRSVRRDLEQKVLLRRATPEDLELLEDVKTQMRKKIPSEDRKKPQGGAGGDPFGILDR